MKGSSGVDHNPREYIAWVPSRGAIGMILGLFGEARARSGLWVLCGPLWRIDLGVSLKNSQIEASFADHIVEHSAASLFPINFLTIV